MKKLWFVPLIIVGFLLTSCGAKGISAEDAGELLIDQLIYQKEGNKFKKEFRNGEQVSKELDENSKKFEENFASGLSSAGATVKEEQSSQLTKELLQQAREKTSYKVVQIDENKKGATISYYVTGLDLVSAMQEMTRELVKKTMESPDLANNDQKTLDATFSILEERVQTIKIKTDPVELNIRLEKEKGEWFVPEDQKDAVFNLFLAFIAGAESVDAMNEELEVAMNEVAKEIIDSLDSQPIVNND